MLAEAGLLDGRAATTHWHWAQEFSARFPEVRLDPDVLYLDEGDVITSAGTAASLDCCLYLLRQWCGAEAANRVARRLVVAPHRQGGQAQFIEQPIAASPRDNRLASVLAWVAGHLDATHSVDSLAARAAMSRRSFTRHFQKATGTTVLQWLLHQRLGHVRRLLFGSAVAMRKHFVAALGLSPAAYRRQFRSAAA